MTMRQFAVLLAPLALLAAAGCATATIEDAVPTAATEANVEQPSDGPVFSEPGQYPNLNVNPTPAATQFTDDERRAEADALRARRDRVTGEAAARGVADRSAELRRLATTRTDEVLREIEGE